MGNNYADFWDVGNGMRRGKDFWDAVRLKFHGCLVIPCSGFTPMRRPTSRKEQHKLGLATLAAIALIYLIPDVCHLIWSCSFLSLLSCYNTNICTGAAGMWMFIPQWEITLSKKGRMYLCDELCRLNDFLF
jgi:hypothetical protein